MPSPIVAGNRIAPGGARPGAGRPPKAKSEIKRRAEILARQYIDKNLRPVLKTYLDLARGKIRKRLDKEGNVVEVFEVDTPTTRHFVDKVLPAAKQELEISGGLKIVKVDAFDPDSEK